LLSIAKNSHHKLNQKSHEKREENKINRGITSLIQLTKNLSKTNDTIDFGSAMGWIMDENQ
jgi:hypothetical protein